MWAPNEDYMWTPDEHCDTSDDSDHPSHPYRSLLKPGFDSIRGCECHVCRIVDTSALEDWSIAIESKLRRMKIWFVILGAIIALAGAAVDIIRLV